MKKVRWISHYILRWKLDFESDYLQLKAPIFIWQLMNIVLYVLFPCSVVNNWHKISSGNVQCKKEQIILIYSSFLNHDLPSLTLDYLIRYDLLLQNDHKCMICEMKGLTFIQVYYACNVHLKLVINYCESVKKAHSTFLFY